MTKQLLEQTVGQLPRPKSNPVPSRPVTTSSRDETASSHSTVSANEAPLTSRTDTTYASPAEELAAYHRRMVDAEYAEHLAALKARSRAEFEFRKGELDRWRERQYRDCGVES